jgi:hypothetical protein
MQYLKYDVAARWGWMICGLTLSTLEKGTLQTQQGIHCHPIEMMLGSELGHHQFFLVDFNSHFGFLAKTYKK